MTRIFYLILVRFGDPLPKGKIETRDLERGEAKKGSPLQKAKCSGLEHYTLYYAPWCIDGPTSGPIYGHGHGDLGERGVLWP